MGTLYVVSTPIGNLEDVTLRALRVMREVSLVCAEDTRTTRKLMARHAIKTRLMSYNEHNMGERTPTILSALATGDVALVSEAGTPGVSDPGYELVVAAIAAGFPVASVPGPSAALAALAVSGLPARQFTFVGFLPRRSGERRRALESLAQESRTLVLFEAPHRLRATLADLLAVWGDRHVAVCRELTKVHEEVFRGQLSEALGCFQQPRGEFTLVVEGAATMTASHDEGAARQALRRLRQEGVPSRDAVRRVAQESGLARRLVYQMWTEEGRRGNGGR